MKILFGHPISHRNFMKVMGIAVIGALSVLPLFSSSTEAAVATPDIRLLQPAYLTNSKPKANTEGAGKRWLDVAYGKDSEKQKMDIYLPKTGKGPFPVIIAIHGLGGDKAIMEVDGQMRGLLRGYAVASINYRDGVDGRFPADVMDAKAAVRFLKAHGKEYGLDPSRIAAWGDSKGGAIAAFLGLTAGHPELEDLNIGNPEQSSSVKAVVAWFPNLDESRIDADLEALGLEPALPRNNPEYGIKTYGAPIQDIPELVQLHDPTRYIGKDAVPFLIEHGLADNVCPFTQSQHFADNLTKAIGRNKVTFITVPEAGHHVTDFMDEENLDRVYAFLDKYLN